MLGVDVYHADTARCGSTRTLPVTPAAPCPPSGSGAPLRSKKMLYVKTSARMVTKLLSVALFLKRKGSPFWNAFSGRLPGVG